MDDLLQAALEYAQRGLPVFPCDVRTKKPLTPHGFYDATTDETQIRKWWSEHPDAQIAMPMGKRTGFTIVDIDLKYDGPTKLQTIAEKAGVDELSFHTTKTGGGGMHLWFEYDERFKNSSDQGIDVRTEGGYVIVPPSLHASGNRYEGTVGPKSKMPDWLAEPILAMQSSLKKISTKPDAEPIVEGGRNDALFKIGCSLRAQGWDDEEIAAHLQLINEKRCKPPLDDVELTVILGQVVQYERGTEAEREAMKRVTELRKRVPKKPPTAPPVAPPETVVVAELTRDQVDEFTSDTEVDFTDAGNAQYFAELHAMRLRYILETNRWIVWDGTRWHEDPSKKFVLGLAEQAMRQRIIDLANAPTVDKKQMKDALSALSDRRLGAILNLAGTRLPVQFKMLDSKTHLLNVRNGTIDLRVGKIHEHDIEDFITLSTDIEYVPSAKCPRFLKFWQEVLPEVDIEYLQRWLGYCLTGENREKKMHIWEGKRGNNGKSTIKNLLLYVFGDYAIEVSVSVFIGKNRDYKNDDLVGLKQMRLVFAGEPEDGAILNSSLVKRLTGMDRIHCRPLHSNDWINYEPTFKPIILTNHELRVYDTDDAFWRRPELIRFNQVFEGENDDKRLIDELKSEAEGVLAWLVEGARKWYESGLMKDPVIVKETTEYRERQDVFGDFIDSYTLGETFGGGISPPTPRWPVLSSILRTFYNNWAAREGFKPLGKPRFKEQMEQHGFTSKHSDRGSLWILTPAGVSENVHSVSSVMNPSIKLTILKKTDDSSGIRASRARAEASIAVESSVDEYRQSSQNMGREYKSEQPSEKVSSASSKEKRKPNLITSRKEHEQYQREREQNEVQERE